MSGRWRLPKDLDDPPPTPSPPGECVPPAFGAGGGHTHYGWRGGWRVNILEDTRHCSLHYISKYFVIQALGKGGMSLGLKGSICVYGKPFTRAARVRIMDPKLFLFLFLGEE
jgi:hypothetical protein